MVFGLFLTKLLGKRMPLMLMQKEVTVDTAHERWKDVTDQ